MQELNILTLQRWTWLDSFLDIETGKELMQQLMRDLPSVLSQAATDICDNVPIILQQKGKGHLWLIATGTKKMKKNFQIDLDRAMIDRSQRTTRAETW